MSSLVKFTPLCGAKSEQPLCYLLEVDEACILLDCGWDETFDVRLLRQLLKVSRLAPRPPRNFPASSLPISIPTARSPTSSAPLRPDQIEDKVLSSPTSSAL